MARITYFVVFVLSPHFIFLALVYSAWWLFGIPVYFYLAIFFDALHENERRRLTEESP